MANGETYEGRTVCLTADITVSTMVGTSDNRFKGTFGANDHTKLFLGENNTFHHPNNSVTIGSCRAGFQLQISGRGDVNSDGGLSIADVMAIVNYVLGKDNVNFNSQRADVNDDGTVTITDVSVLVGMILNESQNLNIVVNTGDTPITYRGGGSGPAKGKKY